MIGRCFWALLGVIIAVFLIGGILLWAWIRGTIVVFPSNGGSQVELLPLFLAAATLVITAVAIVIAIAAVAGYSAVKDAAVAQARVVGQDTAETHMKSKEFLARVDKLVNERVEAQLVDVVSVSLRRKGGRRGGSAGKSSLDR